MRRYAKPSANRPGGVPGKLLLAVGVLLEASTAGRSGRGRTRSPPSAEPQSSQAGSLATSYDEYEDSERGDDDVFQRAEAVSMHGITDT